jgi:hypothetical protein
MAKMCPENQFDSLAANPQFPSFIGIMLVIAMYNINMML